jgi:hypothetical protein
VSKTKGSLLTDIKKAESISGRRPIIFQVAEQLSEDDRKEFWDAVNNLTISAGSISRALAGRGITVSAGLIGKYRRGEYRHDA